MATSAIFVPHLGTDGSTHAVSVQQQYAPGAYSGVRYAPEAENDVIKFARPVMVRRRIWCARAKFGNAGGAVRGSS